MVYEATPPFMTFQYCHCSRCRKASGAAFAANLFVAAEQFRWLQGEELLRRFDLPDAKYWSHCFCATCGSAMPWLTRTGKAVIVPAGGLEGDPGMAPSRNIYWASRANWYVHPHELETFDEFPKRKS